jgi:hypothetical protein
VRVWASSFGPAQSLKARAAGLFQQPSFRHSPFQGRRLGQHGHRQRVVAVLGVQQLPEHAVDHAAQVQVVAQLLVRIGGQIGEPGEIAGLAKPVTDQVVNDGRGGIAFAPDLERVGDGAVHILHHLCDFSAHCC